MAGWLELDFQGCFQPKHKFCDSMSKDWNKVCIRVNVFLGTWEKIQDAWVAISLGISFTKIILMGIPCNDLVLSALPLLMTLVGQKSPYILMSKSSFLCGTQLLICFLLKHLFWFDFARSDNKGLQIHTQAVFMVKPGFYCTFSEYLVNRCPTE